MKALNQISLVTAEIRKLSTKYDGDMTWRSRNTYKPSKHQLITLLLLSHIWSAFSLWAHWHFRKISGGHGVWVSKLSHKISGAFKNFVESFLSYIFCFFVLLVSRTTLNSSRMSRCSYVLSKASCCKQVFPIKSHSFCRIIFHLLYLQIDNLLVFLWCSCV